jgi:hypothetical protein
MSRIWKFAAGPRVIFAGLLFATTLTYAQKDTPSQEAAPDVPDAIQVPSGEQVLFFAHASGAQVYTCEAGAGKTFAWTLKDGSAVTGKAVAHVDSLDADSVPWLLVEVVGHTGKGQLGDVTHIQRVHTHGGKPAADGCDEGHKGAETKSSYAADYYFFAPGK